MREREGRKEGRKRKSIIMQPSFSFSAGGLVNAGPACLDKQS